jgi:hypothetical protein
MKPTSPFDHRPDRQLGSALRKALTPAHHREFVEQVVARARRQLMDARSTSPWEVLGSWSRPGLAAAVAMTVLAMWGVFGQARAEDTEPTMDDFIVQTNGVTEETSFLLSPEPPDPDIVLTSFFEN